jgi:hypothetical protein
MAYSANTGACKALDATSDDFNERPLVMFSREAETADVELADIV